MDNSKQDGTGQNNYSISQFRVSKFWFRKTPDVLSDLLPKELFLRLVGLYHTIQKTGNEGTDFNQNIEKFEILRNQIEENLKSKNKAEFIANDFADYVHNLNLLLISILPIFHLEANIWNVREEYHGHVDEKTYKLFTDSYAHNYILKNSSGLNDDFDLKLYESRLRTEYKNLVNEIRRARLFAQNVEKTRNYLMDEVKITYLKLSIVPAIIILLYIILKSFPFNSLTRNFNNNPEWLDGFSGFVLTASSAIAGATGSLISVLLRIQGVRDNNQLAQNIVAFKYSANAIKFAPLTGFIFAIVLCLLFSGNIISGPLFPDLTNWLGALTNQIITAKLMIWCFIAGFSERLVPDMIDSLADKAKKAERA
jgi:hypothetical protein